MSANVKSGYVTEAQHNFVEAHGFITIPVN
jgi:hypothetical protein